jgi:hypothetical protein
MPSGWVEDPKSVKCPSHLTTVNITWTAEQMTSKATNFFDDKPPRKDVWLMLKVSTLERLTQMQKGLLYMNSLDYFSNLTGEESLPVRMDDLENVYGVLRAGPHDRGHSKLTMQIGESGKEFDLGPQAVVTVKYPRPKNYMLFCMTAIADSQDGTIPGQIEDWFYFDKRFLHFGSHVLLISNAPAFGDRISRAISREKGIFGTKFFHDGFGLVDYKPLNNHSGTKGLYTKDITSVPTLTVQLLVS